MSELEQALIALGRGIEFPPAPDLVPAVRERLRPRRRALLAPRTRVAALAFAVVIAALGIALAVPPARSAILRFFHLGAVTVERVDTLPSARERPLTAALGEPLSRLEAERRAGFSMTLPRFEDGRPRRYFAQPGLIATLLRFESRPVLLAELAGDQFAFGKKLVGAATRVQAADVGSSSGLWLEGAPHVIIWGNRSGRVDSLPTRLAGNVLLWLRRGITYRLEGKLSRAEAIDLATKITP